MGNSGEIAASEVSALVLAVRQAIDELDAEHYPLWYCDDGTRAEDKEPIGCFTCYPGDGSWPCVTRMIANDLRSHLDGDVHG
mgnify:FL=1